MKRFIGGAVLAALTIGVGLTSFYSVIGGPVSVSCGFISSGRGFCQATPASSSYSYEWWANGGAGVSTRNFYAVSASCGGIFASIHVTVTDGNGNLIGSSAANASCTN